MYSLLCPCLVFHDCAPYMQQTPFTTSAFRSARCEILLDPPQSCPNLTLRHQDTGLTLNPAPHYPRTTRSVRHTRRLSS